MKKFSYATKNQVATLLDKELSDVTIAGLLGLHKSTIGYHRKTLGRTSYLAQGQGGGRVRSVPKIHAPTSPSDLAYTAGLFDGEGTVVFYKPTKQSLPTQISLSIANTDRRVMEWLVEKWGGGYLRPKKLSPIGNFRPYCWGLAAMIDMQLFLEAVLPYLIIKKERAIKALEHINRRLDPILAEKSKIIGLIKEVTRE